MTKPGSTLRAASPSRALSFQVVRGPLSRHRVSRAGSSLALKLPSAVPCRRSRAKALSGMHGTHARKRPLSCPAHLPLNRLPGARVAFSHASLNGALCREFPRLPSDSSGTAGAPLRWALINSCAVKGMGSAGSPHATVGYGYGYGFLILPDAGKLRQVLLGETVVGQQARQ